MKHYLLTFFATLIALMASLQARAYEVPYESDMTDEEWTSTIINGYDDNTSYNGPSTWQVYSGSEFNGSGYTRGLKCFYNGDNPTDEWVFSPAIHLVPGKEYKVTHWGRKYNNNNADAYYLYWGTEPTIDGLYDEANLLFDGSNLPITITKFVQVITVDTEGDYYFGFHAFNKANLYYTYITGFKVTENISLPGAVTAPKVTPGAEGALSAILSWTWPTLDEDGVEYTGTLTGAKIYRSTESSFKPSEDNLIATFTPADAIVAGSEGTYTDLSVPEAGKYYYIVRPYDAAGESSAATTTVNTWIGPDTRLGSITGHTATLDPDNSNRVIITFDPIKGYNGGWIDPNDVVYQIIRYEGGSLGYAGEGVILTDENYHGPGPFYDETITHYGKYTYGIKVAYKGVLDNSQSNAGTVTAGPAFELPYVNNFDSSNSLDAFTITSTGSSGKWTLSGSRVQVYTSYSAPDTYMFTPPLHLEAGTTYVVKFDAWGSTASGTFGDITVYLATGPASSSLVQPALGNVKVTTNVQTNYEFTFSVETDGTYYIVFYDKVASGISTYSYLYFDNLEIMAKPVAPKAPSGVEVAAGATGAMSAVISWTNPDTNNDESPLTELTKVEVYRIKGDATEQTLVGTVEDAVPGQNSEYTDSDIETAGYYTYVLKPYSGENTYDFAKSEQVWIGEDELGAVRNLRVVPSHTSNAIEISFDAPEGYHGGYVSTEGVTYKIQRRAGTSYTYEDVAENVTLEDLPYVDNNVPSYQKYDYYVTPYKDSKSGRANNNAVLAGPAFELPYNNDFSTSSAIDLFTIVNGEDSATPKWELNSSYSPAYVRYYVTSANATKPNDAYLITPALDMVPGNYRVAFDARSSYPNNPAERTFEVLVGKYPTIADMTTEVLSSSIAANQSDAVDQEGTFDIATSGRYYVAIRATGDYSGSSSAGDLIVDNLVIERNDRSPLAAENLEAVADENGEMKVTLSWKNPTQTNKGDDLEEITRIAILRNNEELTTTASFDLTPGAENTYTDVIEEGTPGTYDYAVVAYLNEVAGFKATVTSPWVGDDVIKAPENFKVGSLADGKPHLTWDAVTTGKNGGHIDASQVSYTVYFGDEELASGLKTNEYTHDINPDLDYYTYYVKSVYGDTESEKVSSGSVMLGSKPLPYVADFSSDAKCDDWEKGNEWIHRTRDGGLLSTTNGNTYSEMWTITPPFLAKEGVVTATVTISLESYNQPKQKDLYFYLVSSRSDYKNATDDQLIKSYIDIQSLGNKNPITDDEIEIDIPATGIYSIAVKGVTGENYYIFLNKFELEQTAEFVEGQTLAPLAPTGVAVELLENGDRKVTFEAVTENVKHEPVDNVTYNIFRNGELLEANVATNSFTDSESGLGLGYYTYGVQAALPNENAQEGDDEYVVSKIVEATPVAFGEALSLPYEPDFSQAETFEFWTIPANPAGNQWSIETSSSRLHSMNANTWAVTPPFKAEAGQLEVTIETEPYTVRYPEVMEVYLLTDKDNLENGKLVYTKEVSNGVAEETTFNFNLAEGGTYYLGYKNTTGNWHLYLYKSDVKQTIVADPDGTYAPNAPENVAVTVENNGDRTISFNAVTKNIFGAEIEGVTYTVYRDGNSIATGLEATSYTDTEELQLAKYVYGVSASITDDEGNVLESEITTLPAVVCGSPLELPYEADFSTEDKFDLWSLDNWTYSPADSWSTAWIQNQAKGSWAVTPPFIAQSGTVTATFKASAYSSYYPETLEVYLIQDPAEKDELEPTETITVDVASSYAAEHTVEFPIVEAGRYFIGFKNASGANVLRLHSFKAEQTEVITGDDFFAPEAPANVAAEILDDETRKVTFDAVTKNVKGMDITGVTYTIYRDDEVIASDITETEYVDNETGLELGYYTYGVQAVLKAEAENDGEEAEVLTSTVAYAAPVMFGEPFELPYIQSFDAEEDFELWKFVHEDVNKNTWAYKASTGTINTMNTGAWAITPPFKTEEGTLSVTFQATCGGNPNMYADVIELYILTDADNLEEARLLETHDIDVRMPADITSEFTVDTPGKYHLAYRLASDMSLGCDIYKTEIHYLNSNTNGIGSVVYTNGTLVYDGSSQRILIPSAGRLEVFSTNGMRLVGVDTHDHVNIGELISGTYVARFVDADGNVFTLRFVK